jgi:hypothetical protein
MHSPEVHDLAGWVPSEPSCFGFLLQLLVGPDESDGEESFDFVVCTPEWLRQKYGESAAIMARHHLLVFKYDFDAIETALRSLVASLEGGSWPELARQLSRYGKWEFEDYRS